MGVSYKKLWKLLIDKEMTRTDLRIAVGAYSSTFAKLSKDEYILDDLLGFSVEESGETLGKVGEIVYNGINILLSVVGEKSFYIPISGDFIKKVDLEKGIIETEGAKGLIL